MFPFHLLFFFFFKKKGALVSLLPPFCCGGTLSFYALRAMLVSVVGVGVHWLNLTMRLLHVQCMVKFFRIMALVGIILDLQCTYPHDFIHTPHHLIACTF